MYEDPMEGSYGPTGPTAPRNSRLQTFLSGLGSMADTYRDELNRHDSHPPVEQQDLGTYLRGLGKRGAALLADVSGLGRLNSLFSTPTNSLGQDRPLGGTGRVVSRPNQSGVPAGKPAGSQPANSAYPPQATGIPGANADREEVSSELYGRSRMMVPYGVNSRRKVDNISKNLPLILREFKAKGISDPDMVRYALATLNAENQTFESRSEAEDDDRPKIGLKKAHRGNSTSKDTTGHHPFDHYDKRSDLGNNGQLGEGERFKGRGFVQLTGRSNYADMSRKLGIPLEEHPELADDPKVAAKIFAQYLKDRESRIRAALKANNLTDARVVVNGRNRDSHLPNGLYEFKTAYDFGVKHENLMKAISSRPNLTVSDMARIWTEGSTSQQADAYLQKMSKQLGVTPETKFADLTDLQKKQLEDTQAQYVRSVLKDKTMPAEFMAKAKAEALLQFNAEQQAKKQAAAAKKQAHPAGKAHRRDQSQIRPLPQTLPR